MENLRKATCFCRDFLHTILEQVKSLGVSEDASCQKVSDEWRKNHLMRLQADLEEGKKVRLSEREIEIFGMTKIPNAKPVIYASNVFPLQRFIEVAVCVKNRMIRAPFWYSRSSGAQFCIVQHRSITLQKEVTNQNSG